LVNQIGEIFLFSLAVVNFIAEVEIKVFEEIEDREYLSIVRNQGFADHFSGLEEILNDFEQYADDFRMPGVQGGFHKGVTFDGDDQLRNDGENLVAALLEHFVDAHDAEEPVGVELFAEAVEEDRQVVVVI